MKRGAYRAAARKGKSDQIINPGASKDQIMCDLATVAFDRTARAMDQKWGVDRLVDLVSPEMAQRYGQALDRMNQAVGEGSDPQLAQQRCNDAVKGMQAMDRVATDTGAQPASDAYWELERLCLILTDWTALLKPVSRFGGGLSKLQASSLMQGLFLMSATF